MDNKIYPRYFIALFLESDVQYRCIESPNSYAKLVFNDGGMATSAYHERDLEGSDSFREVLKPELALII